MALRLIEGFDHQNTSSDLVSCQGDVCWSTANFITLDTGRFGGKAAKFGINGTYLRATLSTSVSEFYIGCAMYLPSAGKQALYFWDSATQNPNGGNGGSTTMQLMLTFDTSNGGIQIWRGSRLGGGGSTMIAASPNNAFPTSSWFYVEAHVVISTTVGLVNIRINGQDVYLASGLNTQSGSNATIDSFGFACDTNDWVSGSGINTLVDDLYLEDVSGSSFKTFVGPCQVYTGFPLANSSVAWTPLASTNVSQVQETAMDSDTTYNSSNTVGQEDLFTLAALPAGLTPLAVTVTGCYRTDAAARSVTNQLKSSATDLAGTSRALNGTYTYQRDIYTVDPNGSIPWSAANLNNCTFGYKVSA